MCDCFRLEERGPPLGVGHLTARVFARLCSGLVRLPEDAPRPDRHGNFAGSEAVHFSRLRPLHVTLPPSALPCLQARRCRGWFGLRPGSREEFPAAPRAVYPIRRHELDWLPGLRGQSAVREFGGLGLCSLGARRERVARLFLDRIPLSSGPLLRSLLRSGSLGSR